MRSFLSALALSSIACHGAQAVPTPVEPNAFSVVSGELQSEPFLGAPARAATEAGAGELRDLGVKVTSEGGVVGGFVQLPPGRCLLALARASGSVSDVDMYAFSDGGDRLAADEAPDPTASVIVCPPAGKDGASPGQRVYISARAVTGSGILAVGVQPVPRDRAEAVAKAVGARGLPGSVTGKLAAWPGLEAKIRARREALGSTWTDVRRTAIPVDPHTTSLVTVPLEAGHCIDIFAVPSPDIRGVELAVLDDAGRVVARGKPPGRDRGFVVCGASDTSLTVTVRPHVAGGVTAIVVGRAPKGAMREIRSGVHVVGVASVRPLDENRKRHAERAKALHFAKAKVLGTGSLRVGKPTALPVKLARGCTRIDVLGGEPLGRFEAQLWSDDGRRLARNRGGEGASLLSCGESGGARLELMALERPGPFAAELRLDAAPPAVLLRHPVSASRLLARLDDAQGPVDANAAAAARAIELHAGRRYEKPLRVLAGTCLDAIAALGPGGTGLTLRASLAGVTEVTSQGEHTTSVRICAGDQVRLGRLQLGISTGKARALLLERAE